MGEKVETDIEQLAVIGAGVMGRGVAIAAAQVGLTVHLVDKHEDILKSCEKLMRQDIRQYRMLSSIKMPTDEILSNIILTTEYESVAEVDFLVENITEDWDLKQPIYKTIDKTVKPSCIFAANTSTISITKIAALTSRPHKVIGMHFMNPVPMKPTVEVIKAVHTSDETVDTTFDFLKLIKKKGVIVGDAPGFVSNRVLMLTINEAAFLVHEGTAKPTEVDQIFRECFSHKMGPLELGDLIGLDTILLSIEGLYKAYSDSKFRPCPLLQKMVYAGHYGRKSGRGFFQYE